MELGASAVACERQPEAGGERGVASFQQRKVDVAVEMGRRGEVDFQSGFGRQWCEAFGPATAEKAQVQEWAAGAAWDCILLAVFAGDADV